MADLMVGKISRRLPPAFLGGAWAPPPRARGGLVARHRGQALIEMALVVTILLTLLFGIVDLGFFMYRYVQAANCVREAARRAVVRADDAADPPYCVDAGLTPSIPPDYKTMDAGEELVATVDTTYEWIALSYVIPGLPSSLPIQAETSMRMEGQVTT